jgi:hypothetical protein
VVDAGDAPGVPDASGWMDRMQIVEASSKVWKAAPISSCDALEGRLELGGGVGVSGAGDELVLVLVWTKEMCQRVRQGKGERWEAGREMRGLTIVPMRRIPVAEIQISGERFARPGGVSGTGGKGEKERGPRAFYRRRRGEETGRHWSRVENLAGDGFHWKSNGWRLMVELKGGAHLLSWKEKEKKAEQREGRGLRPAGLLLGLGPRVRPSWAVPFFFFFSNFFFLFLFCDLSYNFYILAPNELKINSIFFSKIQHNVLTQ